MSDHYFSWAAHLSESARDETRREMRRRRRALTESARRQAALAVSNHIDCARLLRPGMRVGVYLAVNGELDTGPVIALARRHGCQVFVPLIHSHRGRTMWFVPLAGPLRSSRFGTPEPHTRRHARVPSRWLDLVLMPLVAFGPAGERLGSGAGFYDRAFGYLHQRYAWCRPLLVGLAYHWQQVEDLPPQPWDVPLAAVVTDMGITRFGP
jgi:5-formyltetrahydrofolate cyclo-ligase